MIAGWRLEQWLATTRASRIARARSSAEAQGLRTVLLKIAAGSDPAEFRREYALAQQLNAAGVIRPRALLAEGSALAMVIDDVPLVSLESLLGAEPLELSACLRAALSIVRALRALHDAQFVHGDLRPANLLVDPNTHEVLIADLSAAAERGQPPGAVNDWAYVSPEQTGRTGRLVDHRADFYVLGVLLYRMLSGRLPFQANDPLEWLHCHVARMPRAPAEVMPQLPRVVSDLVMKLMAKSPQDRYHSGHGLEADLQRCLDEWEVTGGIESFPLGRHDAAEQFQLPQKLFGRDEERAALLAAFARMATSQRAEVLLVHGYSGIGKTSLVHELNQPLVAARGYFAAGSFDTHRRDVPYSALTQALTELMRQIISEPEQRVHAWRHEMQRALGGNGQLIVDMIPSLALVVGKQPGVPELNPSDAENRLRMVFGRFIEVFTTMEHPLVLFLDNLQWADAASLALLHDLVTHAGIRALLVVGAYRENEVDASHPMRTMLQSAQQHGARISHISLGPLAESDVAALVADTLGCPLPRVRPLAALVHAKTGGNPFFVTQFLSELRAEGLLQFDAPQRAWCWDLDTIASKGITDNVVDLMVRKLRRLTTATERVLQRAACLGTEGDVSTLVKALGGHEAEVGAALEQAMRAGLVVCRNGKYRFVHDRVQEAAYGLIPDDERAQAHLEIGRTLLANLDESELESHVFAVAGQFNRGTERVSDPAEVARLLGLNLLAGRKAQRAAAFVSAQDYLSRAASLLPIDAWDTDPEGTCTMLLELAECECMVDNRRRSEELIELVLAHAASSEKGALAWRMRVRLYLMLGRYTEATHAALQGLRLLGETFPADPEQAQAIMAAQQRDITDALNDRRMADLVDAPPLADRAVRPVIELLVDAFSATLLTNSFLFPLFVQRATLLSLRHGHSEESCLAYSYYTRVPVLSGDFRTAFELSELALRLDERLGQGKYRGRLLFVQCYFTLPWQRPLTSGVPLLQDALAGCLRVGSLFHAGASIYVMQHYLLECASLDELLQHASRYKALLLQFRNEVACVHCRGWEQLARCLKGRTRALHTLDDETFDEAQHVAFLEAVPSATGLFGFYVLKQVATYLAGRYADSVDWRNRAQPFLVATRGSLVEATHRLFHGLALAALCKRDSMRDEPQRVAELRTEARSFARWSRACPENFADRHALLSAELARIEGRDLDAEGLYEQAIATAREHGYLQIEAIAYERAASFWLERGYTHVADTYLLEARERYVRWGADAKVSLIDQQHPQILRPASGVQQLDTLAVVKASQALSGCINLHELLEALLRIALENAGAQAGQLYFPEGEELLLWASAQVHGDELQVRVLYGEQRPARSRPDAILNYVRRSREQVLLPDAGEPGPFTGDEYLQERRPKSVLCLPLLRRTELIGVLYLENNLATHAFTPERVTVLSLLASQAAISVETARLYAALKAENAQRQRAEQLSLERQARIQRLVESNIIGIRIADLDGRITEANDAFLQIVGYTREDLATGRLNHLTITPAEHQEADLVAREELLRKGSYTPFEKEYFRKDGTRVPVLVGGTLFDGSPGTPAQSVVFALDLTERRRAEAEREARRVAEVANRAKSEFLATMSHELRTPLNGILGYAQLLGMDSGLSERQARGIDTIRQSGEHLLSLISDILDLSRVEAGRVEFLPTAVDLAAFLRSVADIIRVRADEKDLIFVFDAAPDLPGMVMVDERRLRQVLLNLLGNAVKFTDSGTVSMRVSAKGSEDGWSLLLMEVADTGVGIKPEDMSTIFEPFAQVGDLDRREAGTGLGLTITQALVRAMGGRISVESARGRGSCFSIHLRLQHAASLPGRRVSMAKPAPYAGRRRRVLIVDDVAQNRALLTDFLAVAGFETQCAEDGSKGLQSLKVFHPDLVVMDSVMPVMTGLEATRRLRQDPEFGSVPIIAISASATDEHRQKCLDAGADLYMSKPVRLDELVTGIKRLLQLEWKTG